MGFMGRMVAKAILKYGPNLLLQLSKADQLIWSAVVSIR